jgi:hypothetical protein
MDSAQCVAAQAYSRRFVVGIEPELGMLIAASSRAHVLINFVAFEVGWFAVVIGAAHHHLRAGMAMALLVVLLHLCMSQRPLRELQLLLSVMLLGAVWDSALAANHVINYSAGQMLPSLAPVWIIAVWALFATSLNVSLVFLRGRLWLAALFGAIGAPLSFLGGMRLGSLQFPHLATAMVVLAIGWAVLMPLLVYLSIRFDGVSLDHDQPAAVLTRVAS